VIVVNIFNLEQFALSYILCHSQILSKCWDRILGKLLKQKIDAHFILFAKLYNRINAFSWF